MPSLNEINTVQEIKYKQKPQEHFVQDCNNHKCKNQIRTPQGIQLVVLPNMPVTLIFCYGFRNWHKGEKFSGYHQAKFERSHLHSMRKPFFLLIFVTAGITTIMYLPGQDVKVLHEWNPVEDEGLVELLIHDGLLKDLACLLVNQVPTCCIDGESQKCHGVSIRVEEDVGVRAEGKHEVNDQTTTF